MSYPLFTKDWWKAAGVRAARTALVIAIPYVAASATGNLPYVTIASAVALGVVLSLLTSLAGLAELQPSKQNYAVAVLTRVVKTVAQALVAAVGTTVFITDVNWTEILSLTVSSGLGSLLLGLLSTLPETETPKAVATVSTMTINNGVASQEEVPVVATIETTVDVDSPEHRA